MFSILFLSYHDFQTNRSHIAHIHHTFIVLLHDSRSHYALLPIIFIARQFWDPVWADMKCNRPIISHQQTFWIWLSVVRLWICLCWYSRVNYEGLGSGFAQGWPYGSGICCVYIKRVACLIDTVPRSINIHSEGEGGQIYRELHQTISVDSTNHVTLKCEGNRAEKRDSSVTLSDLPLFLCPSLLFIRKAVWRRVFIYTMIFRTIQHINTKTLLISSDSG